MPISKTGQQFYSPCFAPSVQMSEWKMPNNILVSSWKWFWPWRLPRVCRAYFWRCPRATSQTRHSRICSSAWWWLWWWGANISEHFSNIKELFFIRVMACPFLGIKIDFLLWNKRGNQIVSWLHCFVSFNALIWQTGKNSLVARW